MIIPVSCSCDTVNLQPHLIKVKETDQGKYSKVTCIISLYVQSHVGQGHLPRSKL